MIAVLSKVHNRGTPPEQFIRELVSWGRIAPDSIFEVNDRFDIYDVVRPQLGPYVSILHRKAVMLEVLRVLGGFESSWRWGEGHDVTNPKENNDLTKSAGIFQVSADSMAFDESLRDFVMTSLGTVKAPAFRRGMMANRAFAIGYTARLLRFTVKHHGPIVRREINAWVKPEAVNEFMVMLRA